MPAYEFSSKPRAVKARSKVRPETNNSTSQDPFLPVNIHHDPRVARGNTFAGDRRGDVASGSGEPRSKATAKPKRLIGHGRSRGSSSLFFEKAGSQQGLKKEVDLSRYIIEPGEDAVRPEREADTQTDDFENRPQTPDFVPKKTGVDVSTQIEEACELFDLQREIQPLLDVLVGKTLEQARIEVEREHELECIRQAAATLNRQRADESQRIVELKNAAVLAEEEKEQLRQRRRAEAARRRVAKEKLACLQLVRQLLPLSLEGTLAGLSRTSWTTPVAHQIKNVFFPWLFERVAADADQRSSVRETLESLLVSAEETADAAKVERIESRRHEEEARKEATRAARERIVNIFIPSELVGGEEEERLGPICVPAGSTVRATEARVVEWLAKEGGLDDFATPEGGFLAGYVREARRKRRGEARLGSESMLLDVQEIAGVFDEILLRI